MSVSASKVAEARRIIGTPGYYGTVADVAYFLGVEVDELRHALATAPVERDEPDRSDARVASWSPACPRMGEQPA